MEEEKIEPSFIWNIVILIIIGIIIGTAIMIYSEYDSAKQSCHDSEGDFDFQFPNKYFCNQEPFLKYSDGRWNWEFNVREWEYLWYTRVYLSINPNNYFDCYINS